MSQPEHVYIAIDSKSFYASVECRERKLDPLTTNLVVADPSRTEKPYAWPYRRLSKPMGYREGPDCLK